MYDKQLYKEDSRPGTGKQRACIFPRESRRSTGLGGLRRLGWCLRWLTPLNLKASQDETGRK